MRSSARRSRATLALLLTLALHAPGFAQQTRMATVAPQTAQQTALPPASPVAPTAQPQQTPLTTFDTLLSADAYAIYGEVRGLGQYVTSKEVLELIAPMRLPGGAPPEALDLFNFMSRHADALTTARIMFAAMPTRPQLPDGIGAVELSSPEEAQKFETALRKFLKAHTTATTTTDVPNVDSTTTKTAVLGGGPVLVATAPPRARVRRGERRANARTPDKPGAPTVAPFYLKRVGTLVVMSDTAFKFAQLHPADAPLLMDEPGFQTARSHFPSEAVLVYFNTKRIEHNAAEQRAKYEREAEKQQALMRQAEKDAASGDKTGTDEPAVVVAEKIDANGNIVANPNTGNANALPKVEGAQVDPSLFPKESPSPIPEEEATPAATPQKLTPEEEAQAQQRRIAEQLFSVVPSLLFSGAPGSGNSQWPESIAVAAGFEDDQIVVRALLVNETDDGPQRPLPFVPLLLSGPAIAPAAAGVVPADTDVFVSASLDLPQMYDYVSSMLKLLDFAASAGSEQKGAKDSFEAQMGTFEKNSGFRIKDDLIAALGNEIAVAAPAQWLGVRRGGSGRQSASQPAHGPVFMIALNDKQAFKALLPRAFASVGLKGMSEQQLFEKRGEVELLTFAQGAVALIDRYLVVAPDAATMHHVADAYNNRTTLATTDAYRNAARWQPQQVLGQVYVSSALVQQMFEDPKSALEDIDDAAVRDVLLRLSAEPGAVTYGVTKENRGLLHELHVPKGLLGLMSADTLISQQLGPMRGREGQAQWALQSLAEREASYKEAHNRYGTLEDLKRAVRTEPGEEDEGEALFNPQVEGYDIKLNVSGDKFEATATPVDYRKSGRRSFYIDQTGVLRAADLSGRLANATTPPAN